MISGIFLQGFWSLWVVGLLAFEWFGGEKRLTCFDVLGLNFYLRAPRE